MHQKTTTTATFSTACSLHIVRLLGNQVRTDFSLCLLDMSCDAAGSLFRHRKCRVTPADFYNLGTGKALRQRRTIQGHISNGNLFPHIATLVQTSLNSFVSETEEAILDLIDNTLEPVKLDLCIAYPQRTSGQEDSNLDHSTREDSVICDEGNGQLELAKLLEKKLPTFEKDLLDIHENLAQLS